MDAMPRNKFPYTIASGGPSGRWGVLDKRHDTWAERPEHDQETAELLALVMIEAHAAGYAEGVIATVRPRGKRRPVPVS